MSDVPSTELFNLSKKALKLFGGPRFWGRPTATVDTVAVGDVSIYRWVDARVWLSRTSITIRNLSALTVTSLIDERGNDQPDHEIHDNELIDECLPVLRSAVYKDQ
jgi:hypothetical protein